MALSPHANFTNSLKRNNDIFPILTIAGSTTLYLSTRDVTVESQAYDGRLMNAPSIISNIDLRNFSSRTNNITLRIANGGYAPTFGERNNQVVTIYFASNGTLSALNECLKVFTGRIIGVSKLTDREINVNCEDLSTWRLNKILQEQLTGLAGYNTPVKGKFKPISYGDFTPNVSTETNPNQCTSKELRPANLITYDSSFVYYDEGLNNSGGRGHIYIQSIDRFIPIENATTATLQKFNTNVIRINNVSDTANQKTFFKNTVRLSPVSHIATSDVANPNLDLNFSPTLAINDNDDDAITMATTGNPSGSPAGTIAAMSGQLNGSIVKVVAVIIAENVGGDIPDGVINLSVAHIYDNSGSDTLASIASSDVRTSNGWSGNNSWSSFAGNNKYVVKKDITSDWSSGSTEGYKPGVNLTDIVMALRISDSSNARSLKVYSLYLDITTCIELEEFTTTYSKKSFTEQIPDTIYIGEDGTLLESGYTEVVDHGPTEVHENILINFGPGDIIDDTSQAAVESNFNSDGKVRCTIDNPDMTVQDALNKLQQEAGFISYIRPSDGKLYYLIEDGGDKSSEPGISAVLTTAMYRNPTFGTIPLSKMLWRVNINFDKHPVTGEYRSGGTVQDTVTKSTYAFTDTSGVVTINNDWVNESEVATNLLNVFKYQRMTAQCEILDPKAWTLEIGDIITFSDPPADFRLRDSTAAYTDYQFRITDTTRTINSLKIKAMEVYKA